MIEIAKFILETFKPKKVVEVGIGNFPDIAIILSKHCKVVATDVRKTEVPRGIEFHLDDITRPYIRIYKNADLIYSVRPPVSLVPYIAKVARKVNADMLILPFKTDYLPVRLDFQYNYLINIRRLHLYLFSNKKLELSSKLTFKALQPYDFESY